MRKVLGRVFFARDTRRVAEELIGKFLVRKTGTRENAFMITESEAYDGFSDKASHAHRGKTARNEVMFGGAGQWYVYLVYGMHYMLNISTDAEEYPAAVLIRGVESCEGPGRLTKRLNIGRSFNKKPAAKTTGLWIEDRGIVVPRTHVQKTPRIGVAYAGPEWSKKPYRFVLKEKDGEQCSPSLRRR